MESASPTGDLIGALLKRVSRSFYLSVAVLPHDVRPVIGLAYLLARAADTIADTRLLERERRIGQLHGLRDELRQAVPGWLDQLLAVVGRGQPPGAEQELLARLPDCLGAYRALAEADRERVRALLDTLIDGMTQDLTVFPTEDEGKIGALETRNDLARYTYLVAGCVGEFWTEVVMAHRPRLAGWDAARMRARGVRLGQGLQLTNILRDVPRDLRQGRCYLPRQDLASLGVSPSDLLDRHTSRASRPLLVALVRLALEWYESGWEYTLAVPRRESRVRLACAWPLLIGLRTLERLVSRPHWLDPVVVTKVPRHQVYGVMARSMVTVRSDRALTAAARRGRDRILALL
jgi:farnesyl-diphosphate farnesyltransferase